MDTNTPLVSVVVLTYNSSSFIEQTLNSVLKQNYERIELIVSDDGSKDITCRIVEEWIDIHSKSFERCALIKSYTNRGTCKNYNQGVFNSHGEYIKTLGNMFTTKEFYSHFCVVFTHLPEKETNKVKETKKSIKKKLLI